MKPYSKQDIVNIYGDLMLSAQKNYAKCRLENALKDIESAANWTYNFNHIYTDHEAEQLLKQIGDSAVDAMQIESPKADHCVLIDSFLLDNRGLSQQYLRAMMANGMHILVVYTNAGNEPGKDTLTEIKAYDKAKIITYPKGINRIEETKQIVMAVSDFSPEHIFLHLTPWDTVALMACHAVKGANIYQINLTDHAYWMGAEFIDYNLEFRPYGMTVSQEKRGLKSEQCLALPYYPITPKILVFDSLPMMHEDTVKVFTGGALYKMLGKNDIFFRIMERILAISPKVYILVAGFNPDLRFNEKVAGIRGGERVLQIGVRQDIDSLFEQCDIYLGTYPTMGALMSQYAAKHAKPIVAYHEEADIANAVEEVVNYYQQEFCSFTDLDAMVVYAQKLVCDECYRQNQGELLQEGMMTENRFNIEFLRIVTTHESSFSWQKDKIDYDSFFERYLNLENTNGFGTTRALATSLKFSAFTKLNSNRTNMADSFYDIVKALISRLFRRLFFRTIQRTLS